MSPAGKKEIFPQHSIKRGDRQLLSEKKKEKTAIVILGVRILVGFRGSKFCAGTTRSADPRRYSVLGCTEA